MSSSPVASNGCVCDEQRAHDLLRRMDAPRPTATFKKVMALTSVGVFVDAMDVYLAGGVKSTLVDTGFATNEQTAPSFPRAFWACSSARLSRGLSATC